MIIRCVWEHNGADSLLHAINFPGVFTRGPSKEIALQKMPAEVRSYLRWKGDPIPDDLACEIVQDRLSALAIADADSDVLFETEREPLSPEAYAQLKELVLQSARDFETLYQAVPNKDKSCLPMRETFYGPVPRTASEMYAHTKSVNAYYFGEIEVPADNEGSIIDCRTRGFAALEQMPDFLERPVHLGSYNEAWSLPKVLRRFLWHDRIHAKAMYRMACRTFGPDAVPNVFHFDLDQAPKVEIHTLTRDHPLWERTIAMAEHSSWKAGPYLANLMRRNAFAPWERVFAATVEGNVAGYCTLTEKDELPPEQPFTPLIGFVYVDENYRGKRLSQQMIRRATAYAHSLGYEKIYLMSGEHGLYEKYGFVKLGEHETVWGDVDQLFWMPTGPEE